jgi:hypothetical protein
LLKKTRSILEELDTLGLQKDKDIVIANRANHIISGAINLLNFIKENYTADQAEELERRFLNSIRSQNSEKFERGFKRIQKENNNRPNKDNEII